MDSTNEMKIKHRIFIHVGPHKTGSTFVQRSLFDPNDTINLINDYREPWKDPIIHYLVKGGDSEVFIRQFNLKYDVNRVNVISSERLSGHPASYWSDFTIILDRIGNIFEDFNIIFVQREDSTAWRRSVYNMLVDRGYTGSYTYWSNNNWVDAKLFDISTAQREMIALYKDKSPRLLVLKFISLVNNKSEFVENISNFMQVEKLYYDGRIINRTGKINRYILRVFNLFTKPHYNSGILPWQLAFSKKAQNKFKYILELFSWRV